MPGMLEGTTVTGENMRNAGLIVASLMAMSLPGLSGGIARRYEERELTPEEKEAQMRSELAECQAHKERMAAASEKRARKAAKRLKNTPSNAEGKPTPD